MIFTGTKVIKIAFQLPSRAIAIRNLHESQFLQYSDKALMILLQLKSFPGASASKSTTDHQRTIWPRRVIIQIENSLYIFSASINQLLRSHNSLSYITDFNLLLWVLFPLWSVKILSGAVPVHFTRFVVLKLSKSPRVPCSKSPTCRASTMKVSQCCFKLPGSVHRESLGDDFPTKLESDCHT